MIGDKERLISVKEYKGGREVVIANYSFFSITHIGETMFALRFNPTLNTPGEHVPRSRYEEKSFLCFSINSFWELCGDRARRCEGISQ